MKLSSFILVALLTAATPVHAWTWGEEQQLDFSSLDAMKKSVENITANMTDSEKEEFGKALLWTLTEKNPSTASLKPGIPRVMAAAELGDKFFEGMDVWMSGVTADDVKAKATGRSKPESKPEPEAEEGAKALQSGQECLNAKIVVSNFQFESNTMSFDITNNLPFAISAVQFEYTIKQTDRSIAIHKDSETFSVSGGVEPQETRNLSYYYFGPMGEKEKLSVEASIVNAFDAEEMPLLDTNTIYIGKPQASQEGISAQKCPS